MSLDRDTILVENFRQSLDLYQRSLVWAMTASAAFFILSLNLGDPQFSTVSVLYGRLSGPAAWFVSLALFFVLGILAGSALHSAKTVRARFAAPSDIVEAVLLYPSLATNAYGVVRVGTVLFSPVVVLIGIVIELRREWPGSNGHDLSWWLTLAAYVILLVAPYGRIAFLLRHPLGSPSSQPARLART